MNEHEVKLTGVFRSHLWQYANQSIEWKFTVLTEHPDWSKSSSSSGSERALKKLQSDTQAFTCRKGRLWLSSLKTQMSSLVWFFKPRQQRRRNRQKRRQRSSLLFGGQNTFNSIPRDRLSTRMIWRKGWIEEKTRGRMDIYLLIHTKPPPYQNWIFFEKLFICAAKWLLRHSIKSPKSSDNLCLLFCLFLLLWATKLYNLYYYIY